MHGYGYMIHAEVCRNISVFDWLAGQAFIPWGWRVGVVFRRLLAGSLGKKVRYQNQDFTGHCASM